MGFAYASDRVKLTEQNRLCINITDSCREQLCITEQMLRFTHERFGDADDALTAMLPVCRLDVDNQRDYDHRLKSSNDYRLCATSL